MKVAHFGPAVIKINLYLFAFIMHSPRARPINLPGCRTVSTTVVVGNELELQCICDISTATSSLLQKTFPMSIMYESNLPSCCSFPCPPREFTRALSNVPQEITQSNENLQPAPIPIFQWVVHTSGFLLLFRIKSTCWFGSRTQGKCSCKTCKHSIYTRLPSKTEGISIPSLS